MATRSLRSGYLLLISFSAGPMVPGRSPPLISWQVRQLPLPRSKASFLPSAAADCAQAGADNVAGEIGEGALMCSRDAPKKSRIFRKLPQACQILRFVRPRFKAAKLW